MKLFVKIRARKRTQTDRERQTDRKTERQTDRKTDKHTHTDRHTETQKHRHTDTQTHTFWQLERLYLQTLDWWYLLGTLTTYIIRVQYGRGEA